MMEIASCIACKAAINLSQRPKMGMLVNCPECGAELEVVWLDPLELDWPFIDDWDEEDEDKEVYYYD
jgi:alpha-aminoadipate carrier protein LysW